MTDVKRHSEGYWRSMYIFAAYEDQFEIRNTVEAKLKEMHLEYSYCFYGEIETGNSRVDEKAHITFRVNFLDLKEMEVFKDFLKKQKYTWEDHNYDEPLWVKKAYVIGTRLANELKEAIKNPDVSLNPEFFQLLLHGCFNDLAYNKKDEVELYLTLLKRMLEHLLGFKVE